jgi:hypothetical protein
MAKATLGERRVFSNLAYVRATVWTSEGSGPDGNTYDITEVVADTTTVEQAENESNALDHEFSSTPLYENIKLGEKTIALESIDLQNAVLKGLFGWKEIEATDEKGVKTVVGMAAPISYEALYATIELGFSTGNDIIILPKVLLNSRAVIASMKTDASRANINGTCYTAWVDGVETDMAILADAKTTEETAITTLLDRVTAEEPKPEA